MIPINKTLWAAVQVANPKWETPEILMEVPETVMIFESKNDLLMELKKWHYLVTGNNVYDTETSPKTLVAEIRQVVVSVVPYVS